MVGILIGAAYARELMLLGLLLLFVVSMIRRGGPA